MAIFVLIVLILLVTSVLYVVYPTWKLRRVPAAPSVWGIGHLHLLLKHQHRLFFKLADELGSIFRLQLGRQPIVILTSPDHFRELGIKKFKSASVRGVPPYVRTSPLLLQGIFFSTDPKFWATIRSLMVTLFHPDKLSNYVPVMHRCTADLANILQEKCNRNEDVNLTKLLHKLTLDVLGETVFGTKFSLLETELNGAPSVNGDKDNIVSAVVQNLEALTLNEGAPLSVVVGMLFPILQQPFWRMLKLIPGTRDHQQYRNYVKLVKKATELLRERSGQSEGRNDIVSLLLNARTKSNELRELLSERRIIALTYELILGGSGTTANTIGSVLYYVSSHPSVEQKVLQEVDQLASAGTDLLTARSMDSFTYLEQVIKESMRVMNNSPIVAREALEDVQVGGHRFAKFLERSAQCASYKQGTCFWLALIVPTEDGDGFPEPLAFCPERFEQGSTAAGVAAGCFWPFGLGPRMCFGYKFAMLEAKIALVRLYQRFLFRHSSCMERPLRLQFGATVTPVHGVKLRVHARHHLA